MNPQQRIEKLEAELAALKADIAKGGNHRFKPKDGEGYVFINSFGSWSDRWVCAGSPIDNYLYEAGNCYPYTDEGKELAIWEQVTRRKLEQQLKDAADWVEGDNCCVGSWDSEYKNIRALTIHKCIYNLEPRFSTRWSCLEAHERILGDNAKRYFTGEK